MKEDEPLLYPQDFRRIKAYNFYLGIMVIILVFAKYEWLLPIVLISVMIPTRNLVSLILLIIMMAYIQIFVKIAWLEFLSCFGIAIG